MNAKWRLMVGFAWLACWLAGWRHCGSHIKQTAAAGGNEPLRPPGNEESQLACKESSMLIAGPRLSAHPNGYASWLFFKPPSLWQKTSTATGHLAGLQTSGLSDGAFIAPARSRLGLAALLPAPTVNLPLPPATAGTWASKHMP